MAEETSLKASEPNRAIRVVVGVAVIGVLLAALGWMCRISSPSPRALP